MQTPIEMQIECARGEIMNAIQRVQTAHNMPPCLIDGVLSSILADIRGEEKIALINATNAILREQQEELDKAKAAAKKVLKAEPGQVSESDTEQQDEPIRE